jgi:hypothetical protein
MGLLGMTASYLAFSVVYFLQFALAITVCGLYGVDLNRAAKRGVYQDSKWVREFVRWKRGALPSLLIHGIYWPFAIPQIYAVFVGGISAFTTILYMIPFIIRFAAVWIWNLVLFILWIALFGVFGNVSEPASPPL